MSEKTRMRVWLMARAGAALLQALAIYMSPRTGKKPQYNRFRFVLMVWTLVPVFVMLWTFLRGGPQEKH